MNQSSFSLLETIRWTPADGYFLLAGHLDRLRRSGAQLAFAVNANDLSAGLQAAARDFPPVPCRVRLLVASDGSWRTEVRPLSDLPLANPMRLAFAAASIDWRDLRLRHKMTDRGLYERARAGRPDADDVVLYNERGEVTETTIANLVVERAGEMVTPPVACGLLPGVYREYLLARGELREAVVSMAELREVPRLFLINSVREWMPARLVDTGRGWQGPFSQVPPGH